MSGYIIIKLPLEKKALEKLQYQQNRGSQEKCSALTSCSISPSAVYYL